MAELHSFSLPGELIFLPITALLGGMIAFAERDEDHLSTLRILQSIATGIGIFLVLRSVILILVEPNTFLQSNTVLEFLLPIILLAISLPFFLLLSIFVTYEELSKSRKLKYTNWWLRYYFLFRSFWHFGLNRKKLALWKKFQWRFVMDNRKQVDEIFLQFISTQRMP